ncbi:unnamed protein product [Polarella glacialis]|uniref:Nucleolus and neural progenitor protein-like N-terminal domain-containing protein n=1 Tax=Polarella glacialis TaxID=89957 RepID=A0A813L044_POLGL|nr:unnamed protein product [Polarella glacialis]
MAPPAVGGTPEARRSCFASSVANAASSRRLSVTCEIRLPAACQALADEQGILGRMLYKSKSQHSRHKHHTRLAAAFKGVDRLLDSCNLASLKSLAQSVTQGNTAERSSASSSRVSSGFLAADQLLSTLQDVAGRASLVQGLAKASCAAFRPLLVQGFFAPLALGATAVLGRIFSLAHEMCDSIASATSVLLPDSHHDAAKTEGPGERERERERFELRATQSFELRAPLPLLEPSTQSALLPGAPPRAAATGLATPGLALAAASTQASSGQEDLGEPLGDEDLGEPLGEPLRHAVPESAEEVQVSAPVQSGGAGMDDEDLGEPVEGMDDEDFGEPVEAAQLPASPLQLPAVMAQPSIVAPKAAAGISQQVPAPAPVTTLPGATSTRLPEAIPIGLVSACATEQDLGEPIDQEMQDIPEPCVEVHLPQMLAALLPSVGCVSTPWPLRPLRRTRHTIARLPTTKRTSHLSVVRSKPRKRLRALGKPLRRLRRQVAWTRQTPYLPLAPI